jgi:hypothetical protein
LKTAPRPPLGIRLPQLLLGFDGCHSPRADRLGVILGNCQFSLSIRELGQSVIESLTQLNDGCLSAGKLLAQLCYPRIGRRRLSMIVPDIRDLTNDVRPVDLVGHPLAGSEPAKQCALPLGPKLNVLAVQIAVAAHGLASRVATSRDCSAHRRLSW